MKVFENIPENIKGVILIIAGFSLLLHTLGVLENLLWYVLLAISVYLIFVGFVKIKGVELVKAMIAKKDIIVLDKRDFEDKNK